MSVIAYKVFLSLNGSLRSFAVPKDDLITIYRPGKVSGAPIGGFLCFDSYFRAAEYYLQDHSVLGPGSPELWEVEACESVELPPFRIAHSQVSLRAYEDLWNGRYDSKIIERYSRLAFGPWHLGTTAYRKVCPVRAILRTSDFIDDSPVSDPERVQILAERLLPYVDIPDRLAQDYALANDAYIGEIEAIARKYRKPTRGACLRLARIASRTGAAWLRDSFIGVAEILKDREDKE
jgi:hypothetical protein